MARKCGICGEEGHNKRRCPQAAAQEPAADAGQDAVQAEKKLSTKVATKAQLRRMEQADSAFQAFVAKSKEAFGDSVEVAGALSKYLRRISTGNIALDIATFGGIPQGRIIRVYGPEKSSKSGFAWNTIATWQREHCGICYLSGPCEHGRESGLDRPIPKTLFIDAEHRVADMYYWPEGHGVLLDHVLIQEPPDGQFITDYVDAAIREQGAGIGLIVVDSIANFTSREEIEKATRKGRTAPVNALLLNKALRKWSAACCELGVAETKKPTIILVNQVRSTMDQFGSPEVLPGGRAQAYATSLDLRMASKKYHYIVEENGEIKDRVKSFGSRWKPPPHETPYYVEVSYRVTASGVCPNGRYGTFNYWLREGYGRRIGDPDNVEQLWSLAKKLGFIEKAPGGYDLCGLTAKTQAALRQDFFDDDEAQRRLRDALIEKLCNA